MAQVYLDHAATTPPRPEVIAAMEPYLWEKWGNPSSLHATGVNALEGLERARQQVAALLGAEAEEIVFTGSGTEADNHALIGAWRAGRQRGDHVITTAIEHHAIEHTAQFLYRAGDKYVFMHLENYEQIELSASSLGRQSGFLRPDVEVKIMECDGTTIGVSLPTTVELKVIETPPGIKGDTVSRGTKPATTETGIVVLVPLFVNVGEVVRVDTRTGDYVERV